MIEIGLIGLGFGLGVLLSEVRNSAREKDLLDRISWRNPEDYFFMKWQRDKAKDIKPKFKLPAVLSWPKKNDPRISLDPQKVEENLKEAIEKQTAAREEAKINYDKFIEFREESHMAGNSNP